MRTSPPFGSNWPSTQLNSVDFPEPLGPMIPKISPSRTSNDTSLTAAMPPKDLRKFETSRTAVMGRSLSRCPRRQCRRGPAAPENHFQHAIDQAQDAGRAERHHHHDQRGIDDE